MESTSKNKLGLFSASVIVFTTVVGAGVFTTTGHFAADLGEGWAILAAVALAGLMAFLSALTSAELSAMIPSSGGEVVFVRRAMGATASFVFGFLAGPITWTIGSAFIASTMGKHLSNLVPWLDETVAAMATLVALLLVHLNGLKTGVVFNNVTTIVKVVLILSFIIIGIGALGIGDSVGTDLAVALNSGNEQNSHSAWEWLEKIFIASLYAGFAFAGFNAVVLMAGEIDNPGKNIPRSLIVGLGVITLLYLLVNLVFLWATPAAEMIGADGEGIPDLGTHTARVLFGDQVALMFDAIFVLVLIPTLSSCLQVSSRITWRLAQDGELPEALGRMSEKGTPKVALLLQVLLVSVAFLFFEKQDLLLLSGLCVLILDFPMAATIFILRKKEPETPRPFLVPLYPWVPLIRVALAVYTAVVFIMKKPTNGPAALAVLFCVLLLRPLLASRFRLNSITKRIVKMLSYVIPAKKNHWIAIHSDKHWTGNQRAFFDYVVNRGEKNVSILIVGNTSDTELRSMYGSKINILREAELRSWLTFIRAEAVFTHNFAHGDLHRHVINLWHGIPLKAIGYLRPNRSRSFLKKLSQYSLLISSSSIDQYAMAAAFKLPVSKVIASGLPRNDMLHIDYPLPDDLRSYDLRIKKSLNGRKLALFAPTFRDFRLKSKFSHFSKDELNEFISILEDKGYALGIRGHHRHDDLDLPQDERLIDCSGIEYPEMQILIKNTDLFITDYSGGFFDYLIMNKPLISFAPDLVEYSREWDFSYDIQATFPGPICTEFKQLKDAVFRIDNKEESESWKTKREVVRKLVIGNNTGQACDLIYKRVCGNS